MAVVDLGAAVNTLNDPTNRTTLAFSDGFDAGRGVEDYTRINFISPVEPNGSVAAALLGVDEEGHLLVSAHGQVMRSTTAVGPDGDQAADIARGPGCADWVDTAESDDDQPSASVSNQTGELLRLRSIDPLNRWTPLMELAPEATATVNGLSVREQSLLMAVGTDGTCFGVYKISNKASDPEWIVDTRR
jgi:hypothetical protein